MPFQSRYRIHHQNDITTGPCHYYVSAKTGKRLLFRQNEIAMARFGARDTTFIVTVGGGEFQVTSLKPEKIVNE